MHYACPLCGATSNRKGDLFASPASVVGHIDAKRDDVHSGEVGEDYRGQIDEADPAVETDTDATHDEPQADKPAPDDPDDAAPMDPVNVDEVVQEATETARTEGYVEGIDDGFAAGYDTAEQELDADGTCPECGGALTTGVAGWGFTRYDGARGELDDTDAICRSCDLLVPEQGDPIRGSEYADGGADTEGSRIDDEGASGGWVTLAVGAVLGLVAVAFGAVMAGRDKEGPGPGLGDRGL